MGWKYLQLQIDWTNYQNKQVNKQVNKQNK